MTFIALDDEPLALAIISRLARDVPEWKLVATFTDAAQAGQFLQSNTVDLLISDINMPDISGLQFVRNLPDEHPLVIFLTAYKEHAHEGFDLDVIDYLVKPVSPERFRRALQKAADLLELRRKADTANHLPAPDDHFFVYTEYQQVKIVVQDIRYIESMGDYVKIHLSGQDKPVVTLLRLKNLADSLADKGFRRIHRSYLINADKVEARQRSQVRLGPDWLPVGETYAHTLDDLLDHTP
ncbi:MAG: response regulator transcription factor [Lewinella sp.]|nr:response regulator transcription factor [Lewinella sp.]